MRSEAQTSAIRPSLFESASVHDAVREAQPIIAAGAAVVAAILMLAQLPAPSGVGVSPIHANAMAGPLTGRSILHFPR